MIDGVSKIKDDLQPMEVDFDIAEDDLVKMEDDQFFFISFKLTRAVWIHLNVLKWLGIIKVRC